MQSRSDTTALFRGDRASRPSAHRFLGWTLKGGLLRTMLGWQNPPGECTPMVSDWDLDAGLAWLECLRLEDAGGFPDGRAAVLVCQECGDLEGALSVHVTRTGTTARWSDFGWQVPRVEGFEPPDEPLGFEFAADDSDALLTTLAQRLTASAVTIPASQRLWCKTEEQVVIRA